MRKVGFVVVLALAAFLATDLYAQINPIGRPPGVAAGRPAGYAVWKDAKGWHVVWTGAKRPMRFHGAVTVTAERGITDLVN